MNTRERFVKTLLGEKVDRVPFMKVFGGTNAIQPMWEEEHPGIGTCIDELLGFEGIYRGWGTTGVNMDPSNMAESEVLAETEDIVVCRRGDGTVDHNYSIFLHPETNQLFAYVEIEDESRWLSIAQTDACRKWWAHMREIMPSNPDNSPISKDLHEILHID